MLHKSENSCAKLVTMITFSHPILIGSWTWMELGWAWRLWQSCWTAAQLWSRWTWRRAGRCRGAWSGCTTTGRTWPASPRTSLTASSTPRMLARMTTVRHILPKYGAGKETLLQSNDKKKASDLDAQKRWEILWSEVGPGLLMGIIAVV